MYTKEEIPSVIKHISSYPGVKYIKEVEAKKEEIFNYWKPVIGRYEGIKQLSLLDENATSEASKTLWNTINNHDSKFELLVSIGNHDKWIYLEVLRNTNIVSAFEYYEGCPEFVAINNKYKFLWATQYDDNDRLFVYAFNFSKGFKPL